MDLTTPIFDLTDDQAGPLTAESAQAIHWSQSCRICSKGYWICWVSEPSQSLPRSDNLTTEEKVIAARSLAELNVLWKTQNKMTIYPNDSDDLGTLQGDELSFSRRTVLDMIRQRRLKNQLQNMRERGLDAQICSTCSKVVGSGHQCVPLNWSRPIRKGAIPQHRQLVVTQDGQGAVKLQNRQFVDPTEIEEAYKKLQEMKHLAQEQQRLIEPSPTSVTTPSPSSSSLPSPTPQVGLLTAANCFFSRFASDFVHMWCVPFLVIL